MSFTYQKESELGGGNEALSLRFDQSTDAVSVFRLTKKINSRLINVSLILLYQNCHIATETKSYICQLPEREAFLLF